MVKVQSVERTTGKLRMDKEVRERFDEVMQAIHEVDLKAASFLGWAKDYQDHNTKDKVAIRAEVAAVEGRFTEFKDTDYRPFKTFMYGLIVTVLIGMVGYLLVNGQPWVNEAKAEVRP
jgi:hypothetical protein